MKIKMKINTQKINRMPFRYKVNVKVISRIDFFNLYLNLKKGYLKFSFSSTNSVYKYKTFWMNDNFNMYFTNKKNAAKFISLMKCLEKNYITDYKSIKNLKAVKGQLDSEKVFDKMFNGWTDWTMNDKIMLDWRI